MTEYIRRDDSASTSKTLSTGAISASVLARIGDRLTIDDSAFRLLYPPSVERRAGLSFNGHWALYWATVLGYAVVPVNMLEPDERGKRVRKPHLPWRPDNTGGHHLATTDEAQIIAWWRRWPEALIGVVPRGRQVIVDIDNTPSWSGTPRCGSVNLEKLMGIKLSGSPIMLRSGGGELGHWFGMLDDDVPEVEKDPIRDVGVYALDNGFVVVPPSLHWSGGRGSFITPIPTARIPDDQFPKAPRKLLTKWEAPKRAPGRPKKDESEKRGPKPDIVEAVGFLELAKVLEHIDPDERRPEWLKIMWVIRDEYGDDAREIVREWSSKGKSWNEADFGKSWNSRNPNARPATWAFVRKLAYEGGWRDRYNIDWSAYWDAIEKANESWGSIIIGGKARVLVTRPDGAYALLSWRDLHDANAHWRVRLPIDFDPYPVSSVWQRSPSKREYRNIVFAPGLRNDDGSIKRDLDGGDYNSWRGWHPEIERVLAMKPDDRKKLLASKPYRKGLELILNHVEEVLADGDKKRRAYLLGHAATIVQRPGDKHRVALVLFGPRGAGKDTWAEILAAMMHPSHRSHQVGWSSLNRRFNANNALSQIIHFEDAKPGFTKEQQAGWDALITSRTASIERKGYEIENGVAVSCNVIVTTNYENAVPASTDERRIVMFKVSDRYVIRGDGKSGGDPEYFDPLYNEGVYGPGAVAFFFHLMNYPLEQFDVNTPPDNAALKAAITPQLAGVEAYWHDRLYSGELWQRHRLSKAGVHWIECNVLRADYRLWRESNNLPPATDMSFNKAFPDVVGAGFVPAKQLVRGGDRYYGIPPLEKCRANKDTWDFDGAETTKRRSIARGVR